MLPAEGYLVAEMVQTGQAHTIELPQAVDANNPNAADLELIRNKEVKMVAKWRLKLTKSLKKGYATVYDQCLDMVKEKLETTDNREKTQHNQSLHNLINKIERICVGFNDHKQEVFNLVQALKTLFLYTQSKKKTMEKCVCIN
jgi:hypothetical protein